MDGPTLRARQAPLKQQYRDDPASAALTLRAVGRLEGPELSCRVETPRGPIAAGLHPGAAGSGEQACAGEMLLEALVGCAGVTLRAVAAAMGIEIRGGSVVAEGDMDFRGTLGVSKEVPVGYSAIRLRFDLVAEAPREQLDKLIELTERYCVVYQTLASRPSLATDLIVRPDTSPPEYDRGLPS